MTPDLEFRLRLRIDRLTDERDLARDRLARARTTRNRLRNRLYELRASRDLWRMRAKRWAP